MSTAREEDNKYRDTVFNQLDFKGEILDSDKRLFMLIAGVGAGKNYWAKSLTEWGHEDKGYDPAGYRVLLITSRRSTANAQAIKLDADTRFDFSGLSPDGDLWFTQGVVCCTNSYIEWYVKNLYNPDDPRTHIWNVFDFIILDEAHSMAADATFSEAPFHVQSFLRYVHKQTKNCRIILMSGTPEPIEWLYDGEINQKHVKNINLYNTCRHIEPKNVRLLPSLGLVDKIVMNLSKGKRIIYFATTSDSMKELISELNERGIPNDDIGIAYADDKQKDEKFPPELVAKKKEIREVMETQEIVPPDIKILITTSQNKEGININDLDIKDMVVESHQRDEVRQMAGRVRNGLDNLIIVTDAKQHSSSGDQFIFQVNKNCKNGLNSAFQSWISADTARNCLDGKKQAIAKAEKMFRYLRYDYFSGEFRLYTGRKVGDDMAEDCEKAFRRCVSNWEDAEYTGDQYGHDALCSWFPSANTVLYVNTSSFRSETKKLLADMVGQVITKEQRDTITVKLKELVRKYGPGDTGISRNFKSLAPALAKLGYRIEYAPDTRHGTAYIIYKEKRG